MSLRHRPHRAHPRAARRTSAAAALAGSAALIVLAAAPGADAAATVASASASAVTVTVLGTPIGSGVFRASDDGTTATTSGSNAPTAGDLLGQSLLSGGVLGQDALTASTTAHGTSWSCAGLAGAGSARTAAGSTTCLDPSGSVALDLGTVDLGGLTVVSGTILTGLDATDAAAIRPDLDPVITALASALRAGVAAYGTPKVVARLDGAQGACASDATGTTGVTTLNAATLRLETSGQPAAVLADLPDAPTSNTTRSADLSDLPGSLESSVRARLKTALSDALGSGAGAVDLDAVVGNVLANLDAQLAAFDDPLLTARLNTQSRPSANRIDVTALDLQVSDALSQFGVDPARVQIGKVSCVSAAVRSATGGGGKSGGKTGASTSGSASGSRAAAGTILPRKVDAGQSISRASAFVLGGGMLLLGLGCGAVGAQAVASRRRP